MYYLGSTVLRLNSPFTIGGTQYPSNWLTVSTEADRTAIGITWVSDPVRADDRFYWNGDPNIPKALEDVNETDDDGNPIYVQVWNEDTEQMEDTSEQVVTRGLKYTWIAQVKDTAGKMLAETDWMVIRKAERDVDIPADVVTKRAAIVAECTRLETAITAAADMDAFIAAVQDQRWADE
jgi:hypothetical protein